MSAYACRAPVAFLIFNRPGLTERVLQAIAVARPPRLLVVGDGPRSDHPDDERLVRQTRAVLDGVDWPCEVLTNFSDVNLGCQERIASGLDWVFDNAGEAIILEDDCLPDQSFFRYCDELLTRYRTVERVHQICGTNVLAPRRFTEDSYHFSRTFTIWGWATWARAWSHYDRTMSDWPQLRREGWLEQLLGDETGTRIATDIFDQTHAGRVPTWDFQWVFSSWRADGIAVIPSVNLISNIGYGDHASHERDLNHPLAGRDVSTMAFPLHHPERVEPTPEADAAIWRFTYSRRYGGQSDSARESSVKLGDVVMGTALGLSLEQVRPFLSSLRASGCTCEIVLFVDRRLERQLRLDASAAGVTLVRAWQWLPFKLGLLSQPRLMRRIWQPLAHMLWGLLRMVDRLPLRRGQRRRLQRPLAALLHTPMEARFVRYQHYLSNHAYRRVLLTDVRDVVFQSDPFATLPEAGLAVSMETSSYSVATEPHNAAWISRTYGGGMLERIGTNRVSCVGVTFGDHESICAYLERFNEELLALPPAAVGVGGSDTAIHNMLVWTGQLGKVHMLEPLDSPVATLNGIEDSDVLLDPDGQLLNRDGSRVSVLHQYDRVRMVHEGVRRVLSR